MSESFTNNKKPVAQDDPQALAESLYKQNIEISGKNKTLSLLSKLYEISILTLSPKELALRIGKTLQTDLSFEVVGVLLYNQEKHELNPISFACSNRLQIIQSQLNIGFLENTTVQTSHDSFLRQVIEAKNMGYNEELENIWGPLASKELISQMRSGCHIRSTMVYPLIIQEKVIGLLLLSLNRLYDDLVDFEKESIKSSINVVAVALDKSLLHEQLIEANKQLKILDAARAEFITMASHQLRTPPSGIKWYLSALLANEFGKVSGELRNSLVKINVTNNAQISLIDALLNVSRIERGKLEFVFEKDGDLAALTDFTVEQLRPIAEDKKLELVFNKPAKPVPTVTMDKEKIRQVINNMIDNAIKYTRKGKVEVTVEATNTDVILKVKDSGKGMKDKELEYSFAKYGRGKDSIKYSAGLGLGMYLGKVIVEQHNGKIWAESPGVDQGSTFAFSLPINNKIKPTSLVFDLTKTQNVK